MTQTKNIAVAAEGLWKRYGRGAAAVDALQGVSVSFSSGQFAAVMGPSGSGKSTLMHCQGWTMPLKAISGSSPSRSQA